MKKRRKIKQIRKDKNRNNQPKIRNPIAPPSIRHSASKGTGYNRKKEKNYADSIRENTNQKETKE